MSKLHVCRLCKCNAVVNGNHITCAKLKCPMYSYHFDRDTWQKLMHVPAKKYTNLTRRNLSEFDEGFNAAIDLMEKGGQ